MRKLLVEVPEKSGWASDNKNNKKIYKHHLSFFRTKYM